MRELYAFNLIPNKRRTPISGGLTGPIGIICLLVK